MKHVRPWHPRDLSAGTIKSTIEQQEKDAEKKILSALGIKDIKQTPTTQ